MPSLRGREGIRARISSPCSSQAMLARSTVFTALELVKTGSQRQGEMPSLHPNGTGEAERVSEREILQFVRYMLRLQYDKIYIKTKTIVLQGGRCLIPTESR